MGKTKKYQTECKTCKCPVIYYFVEVDIGALPIENDLINKGSKIVKCKCIGDNDDGTEHDRNYIFPDEFELIE